MTDGYDTCCYNSSTHVQYKHVTCYQLGLTLKSTLPGLLCPVTKWTWHILLTVPLSIRPYVRRYICYTFLLLQFHSRKGSKAHRPHVNELCITRLITSHGNSFPWMKLFYIIYIVWSIQKYTCNNRCYSYRSTRKTRGDVQIFKTNSSKHTSI